MAWEVKVGGVVHNTDDLTIDELETISEAAGTGWYALNPLRRIRDARALLAFYAVRSGKSDDEAKAEVSKLTTRALGRAFKWLPDEEDDLPNEFVDGLPNQAGEPSTT